MTEASDSRDRFQELHELWKKFDRPVRLLLVEDDGADIALIERALTGYRAEVTVTMTVRDAIKRLSKSPFDLCLLDLKLSAMSGVEVLLWAKKNGNPVPFIVLTGLNDTSPMITEALDAGVECVIRKPLTAENAKMILGGI